MGHGCRIVINPLRYFRLRRLLRELYALEERFQHAMPTQAEMEAHSRCHAAILALGGRKHLLY